MNVLVLKTVLFLLLPPASLFILAIVGVLLSWSGHRKGGRILTILSCLILCLLSTGVVADLLVGPLERVHKPLNGGTERVDAIVVLTGGVGDLSHLGLEPAPSSASIHRLVHGVQIYRKAKGKPFIISGGMGTPAKPGLSEGRALANTALSLGVSMDDLVIEDASQDTFTGALEVRKLLKGKANTILLVTSAYHMGRSVKVFGAVGFDVIPAPTNFYGGPLTFNLHSLIPTAGGLFVSSTALQEYLSLVWYKVNH